jgi:DNA repair protein RecO (recombination protein O)
LAPSERHKLFDCFVLHRRDYSNSGLLLEVFSRVGGRFPVLAKGAKRPRRSASALLQVFKPLLMAVSGRGEVKTLVSLEPSGAAPPLVGERLYCGFYLNELMMRLLARNDAHENLYRHYAAALTQLSTSDDPAAVLRRFELRLLEEIGYAMELQREADSAHVIEPDRRYVYDPQRGLLRAPETLVGFSVAGRTLIALAADDALDAVAKREAKWLMRQVLSIHLGERPLKSRELFQNHFFKDPKHAN